MDFSLTAEQVFIRTTLRKFVQRELPRETVHELDEQGTYPRDLLRRIAEIGFCGLNVPESFEGGGDDLIGTVIVMEELAAVSPALAGLFASTSLSGGRVLAHLGSAEQQQESLPRIALGELKFGFAFNNTPTRTPQAVRFDVENDVLLVNGSVNNLLYTAELDVFIVPAYQQSDQAVRDDGAAEPGPVTLLLIPRDAAGLSIQSQPSLGWRGASLGGLTFDQVRLQPSQILGGAAQLSLGSPQLETLLALQHISSAALALGIAQGAYTYALNYARERSQFGQSLLQFESIENILVDLAVSIHATRWMLYHACSLADLGKPFSLEAAIAHVQAGPLARQAGLQCVHILGGYGYMAEYDAQRCMRDGLVIFPGAESLEALKSKIGRQIHSL